MANFEVVFGALKGILEPYAEELERKIDTPTHMYLQTKLREGRKPVMFGAVQVKKNYVSFHLIPVYTAPEMLETVSAELRARMQGKSCFNFKQVDASLFDQLAHLTKGAFERYRQDGYV